ncbi:unnamed protein product, partial [Phaeothamnion confervicola]
AASFGHRELLSWLRANNAEWIWPKDLCSAAARGRRLETLQWVQPDGAIRPHPMCENGCRWDKLSFTGATSIGDFTMLQWLRAEGCPWNLRGVWSSADVQRGRPERETDVPEKGCPWDAESCLEAFFNGDRDFPAWLKAHDCPWN